MRQFYIFLFCFLSISLVKNSKVYAQPVPPNCPPSYAAGFTITGDSISLCQDGVNLTVTGNSTINTTSSYAVNNIPYAPYPWVGSNAILNNIDDCWSAPINLPFAFCYFGQKYNKVVIGANGQVSFDVVGTQPPLTGGSNAWASNGQTAPNPTLAYNNCIMAPYHDINPGVSYPGKSITWDIYGTYPCRYMVISWDSIPMFSCTTQLASQQVVLFESTYLIDINIKAKTVCANWNGGVAHEGIQNANGTVAFMVPGRNGTQWTATNDSYRFTPNGAISGNFIYTWIDVNTGATLGTGTTLSYLPANPTKVTVLCSVVTDCDTITAFNGDTVNVLVTGVVNANFNTKINLGCVNDTVKVFNTSTSSIQGVSTQYFWDFGDGTNSTVKNPPPHVYLNQGVYAITLIASANGCKDTMIKIVDLNHPINASYFANSGANIDAACLGDSIFFDASPSTPIGFLNYFWNFGDGFSINKGTFSNINYLYQNSGNYVSQLIVTDSLGCKDTMSKNIFIENTPYNDFEVTDNSICIGQPVYFSDTMDIHHQNFFWNFADGSTLMNIHSPSHSWLNSGNYAVTLTTTYKYCPSKVTTKNITVEDFPFVNLGPDTSICPGLTGSILLTNNAFASGAYLWNTGETTNSILVNTPGYYWLTVTSPTGNCSVTDSLQVLQDCYLNIPNSFSPNGDGLNDYFLPREILSSGLTVFRMSIYNRWGEKIYATDKLDGRGWDGKYNNKPQPVGVFVYVIDAVFGNGVRKNFKGNVTLLK